MLKPGRRYRLSKTFDYPPYPVEKSDTAYVEFEYAKQHRKDRLYLSLSPKK